MLSYTNLRIFSGTLSVFYRPVFCLLAVLFLSIFCLSACVNLGKKSAPPPFLMTLEPTIFPATGSELRAQTGTSLAITEPSVPQKLRTTRIPVTLADNNVAYVKGVVWIERPSRLFRRLVAATVAAKHNRIILGESKNITVSSERLSGHLIDFGIDARSKEAVIIYQASLVTNGGKLIVQRRFETREPVSKIETRAISKALNGAANMMAADVSDWLSRQKTTSRDSDKPRL